ncbi:hypothetical protein BsWGS_14550 [Bradybaena similaris]
MNVYGYIPANYFPSHSSLTYWAQAASFAGLPSAESALTATGFVLGLKKSQLPLASGDVVHKSRGSLSPNSCDELVSMFGANPRLAGQSADSLSGLLHSGAIDLHAHLQHHQQQLRKQQQLQQIQHHHHHFFSRSPPLGSGLAPLQALCQSDVSAFICKSSSISDSSNSSAEGKGNLKFGISRILSDDFGKSRCEKENFQLSSVPEACRSLPLCPCNSASCAAYASPPSPYAKASLPSLSAVHALQPPTYPLSSSADALPGPYSILSTESSLTNQPKRKRSWSRAVFSNLQRKGLEKRFEVQKYVTKPDRRQLAAMLGLTDAQVKVWFQNRRMKWRHAQQQGDKDKQAQPPDQQQADDSSKHAGGVDTKAPGTPNPRQEQTGDAHVLGSSLDYGEAVCHVDRADREAYSQPTPGRPYPAESGQTCPSPQDLRVGVHVSDCLPGVRFPGSSEEHKSESPIDTYFSHDCPVSVSPRQEAGACRDNAVGSRLRYSCQSVSQSQAATPEYNLDLQCKSPASLDIDSDLNDTDVDMSDNEDLCQDGLVAPSLVYIRDLSTGD